MADFEVLAPGGYQHLIDRIEERLDLKADTHGQYPSLSVGRADALTGADETAQWATRVTTGSGAATVRSVQGATVVWNQLAEVAARTITQNGITFVIGEDGTITANGTATAAAYIQAAQPQVMADHKYLVKGCPAGGSGSTYRAYLTANSSIVSPSEQQYDFGAGYIQHTIGAGSANFIVAYISSGQTVTNLVFKPQLIDLTTMFGAGNEPATVAEFERMFPEPYYPYSAPTLKPVQIAGIQSVGFNQWDTDTGGTQYLGHYYIEGEAYNYVKRENSNYDCYRVPVFPSTEYCISADSGTLGSIANKRYVDASSNFISGDVIGWNALYGVFTTPSAARYIEVSVPVGTTKKLCINISNPALNGQYKPYMTDSVEWSTQTLRAAGSVRDELTSDELVTRVGVVDMGTLTWLYNSNTSLFNANLDGAVRNKNTGIRCSCAIYTAVEGYGTSGAINDPSVDKACSVGSSYQSSNQNLLIRDTSYTDPATFKEAMSGVLLYYELATPTTTPISPALPMSYKVEQGGTESIIVPTGEVSAVPVLTVAEGESAADLVMDALACIATPDGPVATSSHAIDTYLTMQGTLYKVTTAIAVGETIAAGTNVTQTTVMAELIARTA